MVELINKSLQTSIEDIIEDEVEPSISSVGQSMGGGSIDINETNYIYYCIESRNTDFERLTNYIRSRRMIREEKEENW